MTLQQLRDFVAVVKQGSLRAAARKLGTSQSGLTKSLQNLEFSLQVKLFQRTTRGITLTPYADAFYQRAVAILRECAQAESVVHQMRGVGEAHVAVGLSTAPALLLAPEVLADFRKRSPTASVHLTSGLAAKLIPAVREGRLDFAIVPLLPKEEFSDLEAKPLFATRPVVVARKDHPKARSTSVIQLADCAWLTLGGDASTQEGSVNELFASLGLAPPRVAATCESAMDALAIVTKTDLLAPLPEVLLRSALATRDFCVVPVKELLPEYHVTLVHRHNVPPSPAAASLASMFVSMARLKWPRERN